MNNKKTKLYKRIAIGFFLLSIFSCFGYIKACYLQPGTTSIHTNSEGITFIEGINENDIVRRKDTKLVQFMFSIIVTVGFGGLYYKIKTEDMFVKYIYDLKTLTNEITK